MQAEFSFSAPFTNFFHHLSYRLVFFVHLLRKIEAEVMILKRRSALLLLFLLTFLALCFSCAKDGQAVAVSAPSQLRRCIALTFDDGPSPQTTATLLDGLKERGAHATFFLIGEQIAGNEDLVRRMKDEGHQVGGHSYTHIRLDSADAAALAEIQKTDETLRAILGDGDYWLRPPWGFASDALKSAVSSRSSTGRSTRWIGACATGTSSRTTSSKMPKAATSFSCTTHMTRVSRPHFRPSTFLVSRATSSLRSKSCFPTPASRRRPDTSICARMKKSRGEVSTKFLKKFQIRTCIFRTGVLFYLS